jgi:hypothetical protein
MMNNGSGAKRLVPDRIYFLRSLLVSFLLLAASLLIYYTLNVYTDNHRGNRVPDIVLDNIPIMDVYWIYIYGPLAVWLFLIVLCFLKPNRFPFVIKSVSLLILVRSIFTSLTHLGPPSNVVIQGQTALISHIIRHIDFGGDFFFSGHTGYPFLMGLIFWHSVPLRYIFVASSLLFGCVVLACHVHYSIDVLAAFFISHSVYHISKRIFLKDYRYFMKIQG